MAASADEIERVYVARYAAFRQAIAAVMGSDERAHDIVTGGRGNPWVPIGDYRNAFPTFAYNPSRPLPAS